jgi:hypothetical protein
LPGRKFKDWAFARIKAAQTFKAGPAPEVVRVPQTRENPGRALGSRIIDAVVALGTYLGVNGIYTPALRTLAGGRIDRCFVVEGAHGSRVQKQRQGANPQWDADAEKRRARQQ